MGAWQHGASDYHGVSRRLVLESIADLFTNPPNESQIEVAIRLNGCTHAYKRQFRSLNGFLGIDNRPFLTFAAIISPISTSIIGVRPLLMRFTFGLDRINADNLVPVVGETSRRNSTDVAQAEYANSHAPFLWLMLQIMPPRANASPRPNRASCLRAEDRYFGLYYGCPWYTRVMPPNDRIRRFQFQSFYVLSCVLIPMFYVLPCFDRISMGGTLPCIEPSPMKAMSQKIWRILDLRRPDAPRNQIMLFDVEHTKGGPVVSDPRQMTVKASSSYYSDCVNRRIHQ
jgi:hypothetical protein